jgi:putative hydrolase of the HAD superfamily
VDEEIKSLTKRIQNIEKDMIEEINIDDKLKEFRKDLYLLVDPKNWTNQFLKKHIDQIRIVDLENIDIVLTSVDVGFRKPNSAGFKMLLTAFNVQPFEMLNVGDEEIDVIGANRLDIVSVLINRNNRELNFGQKYTVNSLNKIMDILQIA